jgi:hypothetical protein
MIEFIDKTSVNDGTPLNRANLMALQGFDTVQTQISENADGTITIVETSRDGIKTTQISADGNTITEEFVGEKTITKTTTINGNIIQEEVV